MEFSKQILIFAALFPFVGAVIHIMILFGGYSWYKYFHAPPPIIRSLKAGTWLAPISGLAITLLMFLAGLYALSSADIIFRLPFIRLALIILSVLFILRGMLLFHLMYWKPQVIDAFRVISSGMFLLSGLAYAIGTYLRWTEL